MASTVAVNGRTTVHTTSDGFSIAVVDVCLLPDGAPVPFVNVAFSRDAAAGAATITCDGQRVMLRSSYLSTSTGDEPGSAGGVISGRFKGKASFTNYSFDVRFEGEPVPRALDSMVHNHGSDPNAQSPALIQGLLPDMDAVDLWLCQVFCYCQLSRGYTACFTAELSEPYWPKQPPPPPATCPGAPRKPPSRNWGKQLYRPKDKGLYTEVTFIPPDLEPTLTNEPSGYQDANGNDIPLPSSFPWNGSVRPDAVYAKDPDKPLTRGNVARVYEAKFTYEDGRRDKLTTNQKRYLFDIAGYDNTFILDEDSCGPCEDTAPELDEGESQESIEGKDRLIALAAAALVAGLLLWPLATVAVAAEAGTEAAVSPELVTELSQVLSDPVRIAETFGETPAVTPEIDVAEWIESLHDAESYAPPDVMTR